MRVNEIVINEKFDKKDLEKLKLKGKKAVNLALKFGDALLGVTPTQGLDLDKKSKQLMQKELMNVKGMTQSLNSFWKQIAQQYRDQDTTNLKKEDLITHMKVAIKAVFPVDPEDPSLQTLIREIAVLTREEIKNNKTNFDDNYKLQTRMLRLTDQILELAKDEVVDNEPEEFGDIHNATYVGINLGSGERVYIAFAGSINEYFRYEIIPNSSPTRLLRGAKVTDIQTYRAIRTEGPSSIRVKDISDPGDADGSIIEVIDGTI